MKHIEAMVVIKYRSLVKVSCNKMVLYRCIIRIYLWWKWNGEHMHVYWIVMFSAREK